MCPGQGMNSDLVVHASERGAAQVQFARFAGVCRTFAPVYRQMTLGAVAATWPARTEAGGFSPMRRRGAWRTYLARHNQGRPFVLIGHSQGSLMLQEIIQTNRGKAGRAQMRLAILPGYNLYVPQGRRVGGTLKARPFALHRTKPGAC